MLQRLSFIPLRIVQAVPVVFGVTIVVFFLVRLLPGGPAVALLGEHATPEAVAAVNRQYGLDGPIWLQYLDFLKHIVTGNLGTSLFYQQPVSQLVKVALPATVQLVLYAIVLTTIISVPLAALAASRPGQWRDHAVRVVPMVGLGMPQFWVGLISAAAVGEAGCISSRSAATATTSPRTSGICSCPRSRLRSRCRRSSIRSLRTAMISVLSSDYVDTARSKGTPPLHLFGRHVLRNAAVPTVTVLGVNVGYLIGGTIVVEKVFATARPR